MSQKAGFIVQACSQNIDYVVSASSDSLVAQHVVLKQ